MGTDIVTITHSNVLKLREIGVCADARDVAFEQLAEAAQEGSDDDRD